MVELKDPLPSKLLNRLLDLPQAAELKKMIVTKRKHEAGALSTQQQAAKAARTDGEGAEGSPTVPAAAPSKKGSGRGGRGRGRAKREKGD